MEILSSRQIKILELLLEFKQLTIPQIDRIFCNEFSQQSIRRDLDKLFTRRRPLVNRVEFKRISHFGKLSFVYSLAKLGAQKLLKLYKGKLPYSKFTPLRPKLTDDYFHRTSTIDFHIHIKEYQSEGYELDFCNHYFVVKKVLNSFHSINRIDAPKGKIVIPDLIMKLSRADRTRLFLFELHNGKDKKRIKEQIEMHALTLISLNTHRKFHIDYKCFYYVLILFEEESVYRAIIKDLSEKQRYRNIGDFFLCKSKSKNDDSFLNGWTSILGNKTSITI